MPEDNEIHDDDVPSSEQPPDAGYLYHQQIPEPRSRHSSRKVRSSHPKASEHNLAREALLANMKTMGVVLICMTILLVLSLYISNKTWDIKNYNLVTQEQAPQIEQVRDFVLNPASTFESGENVELAPTRRKQLDTDTIRKAVFLSKRAESLAQAGKIDEAIERYREALSVWPYLTEGWAQIGRLYLNLKDFTRAQVALERAMESNPGAPEILNDLGVANLFQNKIAKAHELFEAVTEIDPGYAPSYFNIALCHLARKDQAAAIDSLNQYLRLRPDDPRALKEQAFLFANEQQYGKAMDSLKSALTHAPEWPPLYFDAAATAALMGRIEEALRYLDKAEILTTPSTVYQIYTQPAFKEVRISELGQIFEKEIAERARERLQQTLPDSIDIDDMVTEPLSSSTPAI